MSNITFPETLLPTDNTFPYYIVVPPYVRTSAGVAALHVLCHWLNMYGYNAFLYLIPRAEGLGINPRLQTPILDANIAAYHFEAGLTPVVVYPEVIPGNPFAATVRARWIGNYPGLLGGADVFDADELCFAHSEHLARSTGRPANILCIPVVDAKTFSPLSGAPRKGTCFYARKFQTVHGQSVFGLPPDSVEITRSTPPTRAELAALFHRSELFYCFEDSALMNEAALCGCPVVMMKNAYFEWPLGIEEVGWDGYAWGDDPSEIDRAKATVARAYDNYIRNIPRFFSQLHTFILLTQTRARVTPYRRQVVLPGEDAVFDEGRKLRGVLADAILELSTLKASPGEADILWVPDLTVSGARSRVTFVSGWDAIDSTGARAKEACGFTVFPGDVATINLALELDAAALDSRDYDLVHDFDVRRQLTLVPGRALHVALAVLDPGRPVFITITPNDPRGPGSLVLKAIKATRRSDSPSQSFDAKAPDLSKTIRTAAVQFALNERAADQLRAFNCTLDYRGTGLNVEAFAPDPHILVDIGKGVDVSTMPAFLWGAYDVEQDETLQVYMPGTPSGMFEESVSCKVTLKRGQNVFVTSLPPAGSIGPIRIDPLEITGRVCFSALGFVFFDGNETRPIAKSTVPTQPRLDRFERRSLLHGAAFPLADQCVAGYARNALEIRANGDEAQIIFYLVEPIRVVDERPVSIYIAYESTLSCRVSIRFPDADGTYSLDSMAKDAEITRGYHMLELQAALSGSLQSLQLVLHHADIVRVSALDIAFARDCA